MREAAAWRPGTATAVFDVYINSEQTVREFEKALDFIAICER